MHGREKQNEADFILSIEKTLLPAEVKYRNDPQENNGIKRFCEKYSCKKTIILTKDTRKTTKNNIETEHVPVYYFLSNNQPRIHL
jgi:predicted AAA+ superfamily ATPase